MTRYYNSTKSNSSVHVASCKVSSLLWTAVLVVLSMGLFVTSASAQTITLQPSDLNFEWNETRQANMVNDPNWLVTEVNTSRPYPVDIRQALGKDWIAITRTGQEAAVNNAAQIMYRHTTDLGDLQGSVIIGVSASTSWAGALTGVVLRAAASAYNNDNKYFLAGSNSGLVLYWGANNQSSTNYTLLASSEFIPADYSMKRINAVDSAEYRLEFSFIGRELTAALYEIGGGVGGEDLLVSELTYVDNRDEYRAAGQFGLRGGLFGGTRSSYFRDFQIGTPQIPEPATVATLLLGLMGAVLFVRRSKKKDYQSAFQ